MKFSIKVSLSKCDQFAGNCRFWSHLLQWKTSFFVQCESYHWCNFLSSEENTTAGMTTIPTIVEQTTITDTTRISNTNIIANSFKDYLGKQDACKTFCCGLLTKSSVVLPAMVKVFRWKFLPTSAVLLEVSY